MLYTCIKSFYNNDVSKFLRAFSTYPQAHMYNGVDKSDFSHFYTTDVNNTLVIKTLSTSYTHVVCLCNILINKCVKPFIFYLSSYTPPLIKLLLIYKKRN